jgi:phospholipase/carboxylesterase
MTARPLTHRIRESDGPAAGAVVLLHGRGSDEYDLEPLLDAVDSDRRLIGVFPRGPLSLPPGGAHWYVVPRVGYPDPETFWTSLAALTELIRSLPGEIGVAAERIAIGGFSQGAVMSMAVGLGEGAPPLAGILALSVFIPTVDGFTIHPRPGLPVLIAHGVHDQVMDIEFARSARKVLEKTEVDLTYRETPMAHAIDPGLLPELRTWLHGAIDRAGERGAA